MIVKYEQENLSIHGPSELNIGHIILASISIYNGCLHEMNKAGSVICPRIFDVNINLVPFGLLISRCKKPISSLLHEPNSCRS